MRWRVGRKLPAMARFRDPPDPVFRSINTSVGFDRRLAAHDIAQSRAHVAMLAGTGVLTTEEADQLATCLEQVAAEVSDGGFRVSPEDEDIHMAIERRLTELAGPVGGKLHTARSRNDQVATDMAMFVREQATSAQALLGELMGTLVGQAERHIDWAMPGYTHLQRAQPVYLSHHLLAYFWMFRRDFERFAFCREACGELPLGAGALAGVNWNTSRMQVAQELGFESVAANSLDAVSNRDFVLDYLSGASICAMHLSRLGGEIVLWSSEEFGFLELADSFSSGSSIMPQKKNPDAASPHYSGCCTAFRSPTTRTCRRTRNTSSTQSTPSTSACAPRRECSRRPPSSGMLWRRQLETSFSLRPMSPTCSCGAVCRSGKPTGS
jgi:argininosuccinate lyase